MQYPGAYYHVTSRGNEQKAIFRSQIDREKFLAYLESATVRYGAVIHVWCLMDNHYHLLLETPDGNLSQIMRHLNGAYTTYFNIKRQRAGHLFQGRYKAILVEADRYAAELSRYIHLNPVRAGIVELPEDYPWSSYRGYIGRSAAPPWLKTELILGYFGGRSEGPQSAYHDFVEEQRKGEHDSPLQEVIASTLLGSPEFVSEISAKYLAGHQNDRNVPAAKELVRRLSIDDVLHKIEVDFPGEKLGRNIAIHCCRKYSGAKLQEIGDRFGISDAAVCQTSRRLVLKAKSDPRIKELMERVEYDFAFVKS
jgi:REP element-mobilizing transposase RayT